MSIIIINDFHRTILKITIDNIYHLRNGLKYYFAKILIPHEIIARLDRAYNQTNCKYLTSRALDGTNRPLGYQRLQKFYPLGFWGGWTFRLRTCRLAILRYLLLLWTTSGFNRHLVTLDNRWSALVNTPQFRNVPVFPRLFYLIVSS